MNQSNININQLHRDAHLAKIKALVEEDGFAIVTFVSDDSGEGNPYHYTIGLTLLGLPEIILTGRLPTGTARAIAVKMINHWKDNLKSANAAPPKAKLYSTFMRTARGTQAPAKTKWVDLTVARQINPEFAGYLWDICPNASNIFMQILWPDNKDQLPDSPHYTKDEEYAQEIFPDEKSIRSFFRVIKEKVADIFSGNKE